MANRDYKERHDKVAKIIYGQLAQKYNLIQNFTDFYKNDAAHVLENDCYKLYWDRTILTSNVIVHNRPDIISINKITKTAFLIDIAIPSSHNLEKSHQEKISKYLELSVYLKNTWNLEKITILPIILSSTGIIPNLLHKSIKILNLNENLYVSLQKAVLLCSCHIVRKFLNIEPCGNVVGAHG